MKHLIAFALAGAMLASTALADPDMTPEEFFDAQVDCFDSRQPDECFIARYRNATEAQTASLVVELADTLEADDQYGAANKLRSGFKAFLATGDTPGEAFRRAMALARLAFTP